LDFFFLNLPASFCQAPFNIDFVDGWQGFKKIVPIMIRDADVEFHNGPFKLPELFPRKL